MRVLPDARNTQQSLHMLVAVDDGTTDRRADRIQSDHGERIPVCRKGQSGVRLERQVVLQCVGEDLSPDSAGHGSSEG